MRILALEASTTSAKAMLYDTQTKQYRVQTRPYTFAMENPACHDAQLVYQDVLAVAKEVLQGQDVDRISLCTTWHSLLLCDSQMTPMTPVYLWCYRGAAKLCQSLRNEKDYETAFYQKTGCMVHASYPFFKLKDLQKKGMDTRGLYVMGQGEYLNYCMTHAKKTTTCMASGTGWMNIHTCQYDVELLQESGIEKEQLFEVVDSYSSEPLCKEAADLLGVSQGIPVFLSNADGGLNQVGAGAVEEGIMTLSVGTSGALRMSANAPKLSEKPGIWCYRSPNGWLSGAATSGACNCIDWIRETMFAPGVSYEEMEEAPTLHTPTFLPFLFGERCPGWNDERNGGFFGLDGTHTAKDLYLAVQEGVLCNLFQCYKLLVEVNGQPQHIRFSGGILHSASWTQMCADLFQMDLEVADSEHGSLMGAIAVALNGEETFAIPITKVVHPRKEMNAYYAEKYERYRMYDQNDRREENGKV